MGRLLARLVAAQDGWATPLGDFNHRWLSALFRPIRPLKDFLNGRWLGHPLHAAATDIPIGTLLLAVILDLLSQPAAADVALVATILFMLAAAVTGAADYADTDGTARVRATLHSTLMVVALLLLLISLVLRAGGPADRTVPIALSIIGFLIVTAGAYVGGDVVYVFGNMVSRHAFRGAGTKWIKLDTGDVTDLATLPEATPTKAKAGINDLVLVRVGRHDPRDARRLRARRRPARPGHGRGRLPRVPVARLAVPGRPTATSAAVPPCTTSRPTRSAPPRAEATRSAATADLGGSSRGRPSSGPEPGRPDRRGRGRASRRSRHGTSTATRSCRPTRSGRWSRATRPTSARPRPRSAGSIASWRDASRPGRLTVVDATSVEPIARRALLARAAAAGVPATAIVLDLPAETSSSPRNAARPRRVVDEASSATIWPRLRASLDGPAPPLAARGSPRSSSCATRPRSTAVRIRRRPA